MTTGTQRKKIIYEKLHFAQIYFGLQISFFASKIAQWIFSIQISMEKIADQTRGFISFINISNLQWNMQQFESRFQHSIYKSYDS